MVVVRRAFVPPLRPAAMEENPDAAESAERTLFHDPWRDRSRSSDGLRRMPPADPSSELPPLPPLRSRRGLLFLLRSDDESAAPASTDMARRFHLPLPPLLPAAAADVPALRTEAASLANEDCDAPPPTELRPDRARNFAAEDWRNWQGHKGV